MKEENKNAIETIKLMIEHGHLTQEVAEQYFPELAESEDERIRKEIVRFIQMEVEDEIVGNKWLAWLEKQNSNVDNANKEYWRGYREGKQEILDKYAELEKQGEQSPIDVRTTGYWHVEDVEQKPAWSEKDENLFKCAIDAVKQESKVRTDGCLDEEVGEKVINWLKSLKDRDIPQPVQKWSEEDESILQGIWDEILANKHQAKEYEWKTYDKFLSWLKSIRPQKQWKPSEEQMEALWGVTEKHLESDNTYTVELIGKVLESLYHDLKKLKE